MLDLTKPMEIISRTPGDWTSEVRFIRETQASDGYTIKWKYNFFPAPNTSTTYGAHAVSLYWDFESLSPKRQASLLIHEGTHQRQASYQSGGTAGWIAYYLTHRSQCEGEAYRRQNQFDIASQWL